MGGAGAAPVGATGALRRRATTYLPSTLLAAIERHGGDRSSFVEPTDGTLVFADVSGFTPLSEALAATGREGAERLTAVLNDFFGRMLDIAATWGGSNQKFGGDAMLLLYSGPDHARRAVEASLDMQRATGRFPAVRVGAGRHKLAMSIGVHSGRSWAAGVGVPDARMQHVLLGHDCGRVADAEAAASAGQVVVSAETRALLGSGIATSESDSAPGMYVVGRRRRRIRPLTRVGERPSPSDERLRAYLPSPLARALSGDAAGAGGRVEDEHRRVVVLFISVVGLNELLASAGPEAALGRAQAYVSTLVELTERHGGFISNNDIDSAGLKFIVLFGAPIAREDDAASALRLAADLVEEVARRGIDVRHRVGINSGYVFAGDVGSDLRRDYTVIGDAVNLAARLMGAAEPGQVVVADWVAAEAGDGFELRDRRSIRVKGKSMAIAVHSLVGERSSSVAVPAGPAPVVIGRERERRSLRRAAARAHAGSPRLVAVHGEAGVGGSALVAELVHELMADGWSAHRGRARQHLGDVPFGPVVGLFERLLGIVGVEDPAARGAAVVAALGSELPEMAPMAALLNGLLSTDVVESDVVRALDPTERADRLAALLVGLVGAATQDEPLVLTVEGLHFADRATIRFLEQGMRTWRSGRLLVVVSFRDDLAPEFGPPRARTVDLALGPLDRSDSDALVRHLLGRPDVSESLLAEIHERSRGTPLVTAELARAVGASELLDDAGEPDPRQVRQLLGGLDVPDRLQRLVMARIDRLAPAPRWALTRAAVIGSSFDRPALQALVAAEGRRVALPAAMRQLAEVGLVAPDPQGPRGSYVFGHEAIRDVAYDSLLFRTRRELHHELARHLQERHATDLDREAATIAGHLRIARDLEAAGVFGVRAGDFAMASYAVEEAEASFAGAFDDFRQAGPHLARERSYASERVGDCAVLAGRALDAVARYQQALRSWRRAGDEPTPLVDSRLAGDRPVDEREAELSLKVARAQQGADRYDRALEWLDRAQREAPRRSPRLMAEVSALRSGTQFRLGRYADAAREGARALTLAERTGDAVTIGYARNLLAGIFLEQGRLEEAIEQRTEAVQLFEEAGDLRGAMVGHGNLGASYQLVGDLDAARRHYEQAGEAAARLGNAQGRALIENNVGEVLLVQGRLDEAATRFATTVRLHEETAPAPVWAGLARVNLSRVALRRGDLGAAHRELDQGTRLLRRARARGLLLEATHQRVSLRVAEGDLDAAERANRRFAADARRMGMQLFEARSAILAGRIALARGRSGPAASELRRAITLAESAGARPEQAEAWALLADAGLDDGAAARAAELARALGVTAGAFIAAPRAG